MGEDNKEQGEGRRTEKEEEEIGGGKKGSMRY